MYFIILFVGVHDGGSVSVVIHLPKKSSMKNWSRIEKKYVAFYTKHIFTHGYTSSQRLESLNNFFKDFRSLKKEIIHWNICQSMTC